MSKYPPACSYEEAVERQKQLAQKGITLRAQKDAAKQVRLQYEFRRLCKTLAERLLLEDPSLSGSAARREARRLVLLDWKEHRKTV